MPPIIFLVMLKLAPTKHATMTVLDERKEERKNNKKRTTKKEAVSVNKVKQYLVFRTLDRQNKLQENNY